MIAGMINSDELQQSILFVVIERDNLERMKQGDPATLESIMKGGVLLPPRWYMNFSVLIAYEEDDAELYRHARDGNGLELLQWLERGRKFVKGLDGAENTFSIRKEPSDAKRN
jgi:hypothetical protein